MYAILKYLIVIHTCVYNCICNNLNYCQASDQTPHCNALSQLSQCIDSQCRMISVQDRLDPGMPAVDWNDVSLPDQHKCELSKCLVSQANSESNREPEERAWESKSEHKGARESRRASQRDPERAREGQRESEWSRQRAMERQREPNDWSIT